LIIGAVITFASTFLKIYRFFQKVFFLVICRLNRANFGFFGLIKGDFGLERLTDGGDNAGAEISPTGPGSRYSAKFCDFHSLNRPVTGATQ
jgi:hypothetical protein